MKQVVDNFSSLAVEYRLVSKLPTLFTTETVFNLTDEAVARIAAESWETANERTFLTEKMGILQSGMLELRRLSKHHQHKAGKFPFQHSFAVYSSVVTCGTKED